MTGKWLFGHSYHWHAHGPGWVPSIHWALFTVEYTNIDCMLFAAVSVLGFWASYTRFK